MAPANPRKAEVRALRHLGVYVDSSVYRAVKLQAAQEDRSMSELMRDAVELYLGQSDLEGFTQR